MAMDSKKPKINVNNGYNGGLNNAVKSSPSFDPRAKQNANPKNGIKKELIKTGIKKAAQAYGVPEAATEQLLNSSTGEEALNAASSAPTISQGAVEGTKVIIRKTLIKNLPLIAGPFLIILLFFILIFSKDAFGGIGDATDIYEDLRNEITEVVSSYRRTAELDGNLILATLIAYNDMEDIENDSSNSKNIAYMKNQVSKLAKYQIMTTKTCSDDSSTIRKIASNDDFLNETNNNCVLDDVEESYSLSIEEGRIDDDNSGSVYYWNLIDEGFIFNYYNEYMPNKDDEASDENKKKIADIISEIYSYYKVMDKQSFVTAVSVCNKGITVDGVTMDLEDYIKGVVYAELGDKDVPIEALKAQAVVSRSLALNVTNNCTRELTNKNIQKYKEGYEDNPLVVEAVDDTMGRYISLDDKPFYASFTTFPSKSSSCNVKCNNSSCTADFSYDMHNKLGSHTLSIPKNLSYFDIESYVNDTSSNAGCIGMSQLGAWYDAENGLTYEEIIEKYYSDKVVITVGATEGLVKDENGYLKRVSRATIDNLYYYAATADLSKGFAGLGSYEGECAWYAVRRTNEIIATMGLQNMYKYVTNGGDGNGFCTADDYQQFEHSYNPNDSTLRAGSIISWNSDKHKYGHVAVVEAVYRDSNGNIISIDISEAGISFGSLAKAGFTTSSQLWNYSGSDKLRKRSIICEENGCQHFKNISMETIKYNFICYLKIT